MMEMFINNESDFVDLKNVEKFLYLSDTNNDISCVTKTFLKYKNCIEINLKVNF